MSQLIRNRSGQYVPQPSGFSVFVPNPLPPDPPINMDRIPSGLLSKADQALGRLDGATLILPNPDLFVSMYMMNEAVLSSQIEGTQASLIDVLAFDDEPREPSLAADVVEIRNYLDAMRHGISRLGDIPVSLRLLREIHEILLSGGRGSDRSPGAFRTVQNWLGPPGCPIERATFVPPPPDALPDLLSNLETFLHEDELPVLLRVGLAHAQFETIHPFLDGNGRLGRMLVTFLLCERKVLRRPLLYLSHYLKVHRNEYYSCLQAIREDGDWEGWITFFLQGIVAVADEATVRARQIVIMREKHRQLLQDGLGRRASAGLSLLEHLFDSPSVSVNDVAQVTGLAFANANSLVQEIEGHGLLEEITGRQRNRRYVYLPYVKLFTSPSDPTLMAI